MTDEKSTKDPMEEVQTPKEPAKEQKSEAGSQKAEAGSQKAEAGSPSFVKTTEGRQKVEAREQKAEGSKKKSEDRKSEGKKDKKIPKKPTLTEKEIDKLIVENLDLQAKTKEIQDNFLLLAAEFENYKKRINKDQVRTKEIYKDSMLSNLLPVLDDIDRALQHHDQETETGQGFMMVRSKLLSYLESYKVSPFNSVGEEFDPEKHHAMLTRTVEGEKDNIILEEFEKGYMIDEKVLRHAKVIVNIIE